jgi:hypothetical protein
MACAFEGGANGRVIEDFAVVGDPYGTVFVGHRLVPARDVDDAEAAVPKECRSIFVHALTIRPAVPNGVHHVPQVRG